MVDVSDIRKPRWESAEENIFDFAVIGGGNNPANIELPVDLLIKALQAEGCMAAVPRYPLLHQQPFFTEGHFQSIVRLGDNRKIPEYRPDALPKIEEANKNLLRLPSFATAKQDILDQYIEAFEKVLKYSSQISEQLS